MATLYVRNVPTELYAELKQWAEDSCRSVNAEILDVLEREAAERRQRAEFQRRLAELRQRYEPIVGPPWPEDLIREDRDRGHKPEFGY
ncbi:MAG: FitA-like ribbon-helix-helix domain-containing protein [Gaiellaceae bacterium]